MSADQKAREAAEWLERVLPQWQYRSDDRGHAEGFIRTLLDSWKQRGEEIERAVGFREGHPAMCCGQCHDTLERLKSELAAAQDERRQFALDAGDAFTELKFELAAANERAGVLQQFVETIEADADNGGIGSLSPQGKMIMYREQARRLLYRVREALRSTPAKVTEPEAGCMCDVGWRHCPIHQDDGREPEARPLPLGHSFVPSRFDTRGRYRSCIVYEDGWSGLCGQPESAHLPTEEITS